MVAAAVTAARRAREENHKRHGQATSSASKRMNRLNNDDNNVIRSRCAHKYTSTHTNTYTHSPPLTHTLLLSHVYATRCHVSCRHNARILPPKNPPISKLSKLNELTSLQAPHPAHTHKLTEPVRFMSHGGGFMPNDLVPILVPADEVVIFEGALFKPSHACT